MALTLGIDVVRARYRVNMVENVLLSSSRVTRIWVDYLPRSVAVVDGYFHANRTASAIAARHNCLPNGQPDRHRLRKIPESTIS